MSLEHSQTDTPVNTSGIDRRAFMGLVAGASIGAAAGSRGLTGQQQASPIQVDILDEAEALIGLEFSGEERELMLRSLRNNRRSYEQLRTVDIPNSVSPAVVFDPAPGQHHSTEQTIFRYTRPTVQRPANLEELAFAPVTVLAELVRTRRVTSMELTEMYLARIARHGPTLECIVTVTEDLARLQARRADQEIARGSYRGPLHGIPWGGKDLLAEDAYRTTWGAKPYEDQQIDYDATVVQRLEEAGAVLVAKTTLGALAQGDVWFGGRTKNPWNLEQGSSGSSAGSASATVAGLVGFSIGTETLGSIVSPSTRCGASGLRPTFGRVSRHGAMALSWTMDKIGPICRSAEDCALVFNAIHGADGKDPTARTVAFDWDRGADVRQLRVGYYRNAFEEERSGDDGAELARFDNEVLSVLRAQGIEPVPIDINVDLPVSAMRIILSAEASAAFDTLTRSNRDDLLVSQSANSWPTTFRQARFIPAVEYIQANRLRTMAMGRLESQLAGIDAFVTPSYGGDVLLLTNLTGHPTVVVPNGYRSANGTPTSISFVGKLYGDAAALSLAKAFQDATEFNRRRPPLFS